MRPKTEEKKEGGQSGSSFFQGKEQKSKKWGEDPRKRGEDEQALGGDCPMAKEPG